MNESDDLENKMRRLLTALDQSDALTDDASTPDAIPDALSDAVPNLFNAMFARDDDFELNIGDHYHAYKLLKLLAAGGMGKVFLAKRDDGRYEHHVALKILNTPFPSEQLLKRFLRESQILADLKHPFIVSILDAGVDRFNRPWFVIDYIDGVDIVSHTQQADVGLQDKIRLVRDVCQAIGFAHSRGIIHRDIKPANVLVRSQAERSVPCVLDFGIAHNKQDPSLTHQGVPMGTPAYMAPEQIRAHDVSERTDVFSLGVVLYEVLTGVHPFLADGVEQTQRNILHLDPAPLKNHDRTLPQDLQTVLSKCLAKAPEARYQNITELQQDLDLWLKGYPVRARKPSLWSFIRAAMRRNVWASVAVLGAAFTLIAGAIYYTGKLAQERRLAVQANNAANALQQFMLEDLQEQLQAVGRTDVLKNVAQNTLQYLENHPGNDDTENAYNRAKSYLNVADVLESEKQLTQATSALLAAEALLQRIRANDPENAAYRATAVIVQTRKASLLHTQGQLKEAEQTLQQAGQVLPDPVPKAIAPLQRALWEWRHVYSWNQMEQGHYPRAAELLQQMLDQCQQQLQLNDATEWRRKLYRTLQTAAWNHSEMKDQEAAIAAYQRGIHIVDALLQDQPNHAQLQIHKQLMLNQLSYVQQLAGRSEEAKGVIAEAMALGELLHLKLPANNALLRELAYSYTTQSEILIKAGELTAALELIAKSTDISRQLAALEPNNQSAQNDLAVDLTGMALVHAELGQIDSARQRLDEARAVIEPLALQTDASLYYVHSYARAMVLLGQKDRVQPQLLQLKNHGGWGERVYNSLMQQAPLSAGEQQ